MLTPGKPHDCDLCHFNCKELPEYSKHIDSPTHKNALCLFRTRRAVMEDTEGLQSERLQEDLDCSSKIASGEDQKASVGWFSGKKKRKRSCKRVKRKTLLSIPLNEDVQDMSSEKLCKYENGSERLVVEKKKSAFEYSCEIQFTHHPYTAFEERSEISTKYHQRDPGAVYYDEQKLSSPMRNSRLAQACNQTSQLFQLDEVCHRSASLSADQFLGVSEKNDSNLSTENHAGFSKTTFEKQLMPVLEHANRKPRYSLSCKSLRIDPKRKYEKMALKGRALFSKNLHIMMSKNRHSKYRLVPSRLERPPIKSEPQTTFYVHTISAGPSATPTVFSPTFDNGNEAAVWQSPVEASSSSSTDEQAVSQEREDWKQFATGGSSISCPSGSSASISCGSSVPLSDSLHSLENDYQVPKEESSDSHLDGSWMVKVEPNIDSNQLEAMWSLVAEESSLFASLSDISEKLNRMQTEIMEEIARKEQIEKRINEVRGAKARLLGN
ncbi:unnamed protein product [Enterobius vermicularis]|uniref:Ig-like domain-containing protein n=1 Tax=Enterobius vermicularis TaxID=51028 RepID=A0A0N4V3S0_ENTVE|nr:unnamed protein product [Enterobius vermicularis]